MRGIAPADLPTQQSWTLRVARLIRLLLALTLVFFSSQPAVAEAWWPAAVAEALERAGPHRSDLRLALEKVPVEQRAGMVFLIQHMPEQDLRHLSAEFLLSHVDHAYAAWVQAPWAEAISEPLFLNYILPYVNVSEAREPWMEGLREISLPLVAGAVTPAEAAQRLNEKLFRTVQVKYSTHRRRADQAPSETMATGLASCTGLSILLVDACRSVGIPARLVGTPNWVNQRGNHTWVEVWDRTWHFTGAAEPDSRGLNHAWFQAIASQAIKESREHAIYAVSYKPTGLTFPLLWAPGSGRVNALNITDRYTRESDPLPPSRHEITVAVRPSRQAERVAAHVRIQPLGTGVPHPHQEGISHDLSHDTNDLLAFRLPQAPFYGLVITHEGRQWHRRLRSNEARQQHVLVILDETESDPPEACSLPPEPPLLQEGQGLQEAWAGYFDADPQARQAWRFDSRLEAALADQPSAVRALAWTVYRRSQRHAGLKEQFEARQVRSRGQRSPYTLKTVGHPPPEGWPLFIALHGGGGVPKEINDRGWQVMQRYYRDQSSVPGYLYLALRAPNDRWNGFYDEAINPLVDTLIRQLLLFGEVDPNKVFLMGYSHGGYGAFSIGPKMPDRFAAIHSSAAAPTDGQTAAVNLRHTRFTFMIGEHDTAHGRLRRCRAFQETIEELRGDRDDLYPVTMEYKVGHGHGGLPDRDKILSMYPALRDPVPDELTWEMTDHVVTDFYWFHVPDPAPGQFVEASCRENTVTVTTRNVKRLHVLLDERLVDLSRPITLRLNGRASEHVCSPSLGTLGETLLRRGDPDLAFSVALRLAP